MSLFSCVFLVLYGGSGSYGRDRIVQSVTPSMPGKLNSMCVLVLLFIFKVHFLNTCFSHVQCGVYIAGVHTVGLALGSPLEFWELNRNEHLGSIYF